MKGGFTEEKKKEKEKQAKQTEEEMVNDLATFWRGLYTHKECQVALRRNGFQLNEASTWLHTCGAYLREPMVIPTVSSVVLAAAPKSGALDPVLLIAGTWYATRGQLCVVSPPGLYTVGEEHSDKTKSAANSCDASWFFSLESGASLGDKPILLKGIPAGSPTCVDTTRKRILVFSGYLNCLEEYVDHVQQGERLKCAETQCDTLADSGKVIIAQIAQLTRKRAALPAYKHPRAGLQDILFRTGRETVGTDKQSDGRRSEPKDTESGTKSRNRRMKNIRARLSELDRLHVEDRPGHIIPFCVDFEDSGFLQIIQAFNYYCKQLSAQEGHRDESGGPPMVKAPVGINRLIADLLCILTEAVQEFDFAGVTVKIDQGGETTQKLFKDTEHSLRNVAGQLFGDQTSTYLSTDTVSHHERSEVVKSAHFLLVWGLRKSLFCLNNRPDFSCPHARALSALHCKKRFPTLL